MNQKSSNDLRQPWGSGPNAEPVVTVVRAELRSTPGGPCVSLDRELRSGDVVLAGGPVWSKTVAPSVAEDVFAALEAMGDGLVLLAEAALVLPAGHVDAAVDRAVAEAIETRRAAEARAADELAKSVEKERKNREIHAYLTGDKKAPVLELSRGARSKSFLKLRFGAEWERDRFWDWLKWQTGRYEEFEAQVATGGADEVKRLLLYEMLGTEQAVRKRGLGAGGRRPLLFWRGDL